MSFIISNRQSLAPKEQIVRYKPFVADTYEVRFKHVDVAFGHPLYTTIADIICADIDASVPAEGPVIPDGCMSILFRMGDGHTQAYFCGPIDEIKKISIRPGEKYVSLKFYPGLGGKIAGQPAVNLVNQVIPLEQLVPWSRQATSIMERDNNLDERIRLVSRVIKVNSGISDDRYLVKYCTDRIIQTNGGLKVEQLAEETGFTSRHIGKEFEKRVGVSPKFFSQIVRLQSTMERMFHDKDSLLVDIAVDSGFFDHAHMNRMYKKLIHCSSGEFRKNYLNKLDYSDVEEYIAVG